MRKIIFVLVFALITCISVTAQDSAFASVRYSFTHIMDTTQPDNPLKENMILYLGKNMSNYTSYDRIERLAKQKAGGGQAPGGSLPATAVVNGQVADIKSVDISTVTSISVNNGVVTINANPQMALANSYYKDESASKLSYITFANGKMFSVEEKTPAIKWEITQEAKEIQGMQCQKAVGEFRGRTYEAWFCSQLPYNNGPWKLGGLPGLIVEAYDTKKEVEFRFTSFENSTGAQVAIELPKDFVKTTPKEFKQYQEAVAKDRQAMVGNNSGGAPGAVRVVAGGRIGASTVDMNGNQ